jgi:hypothetical protein
MSAHGGGERRAAHRHAERRENLFPDHGAIGFVLRLRQRIAQQPEAQIGVFVGRARIARQLVFRKKSFQLRRIVVSVGIGRVLRQHVGWQPRQTRVLRGELAQRNLLATARRDFETRQKLRHRRVERHAPREHGAGQGRRREGLRQRADFVNRVAIGHAAVIELAENHDLALVAVHHAEYQRLIGARRDAFLCGLFHPLGQESCVRRHARHDAYRERPRNSAAVQQREHGLLPLTSGSSKLIDLSDSSEDKQTRHRCGHARPREGRNASHPPRRLDFRSLSSSPMSGIGTLRRYQCPIPSFDARATLR